MSNVEQTIEITLDQLPNSVTNYLSHWKDQVIKGNEDKGDNAIIIDFLNLTGKQRRLNKRQMKNLRKKRPHEINVTRFSGCHPVKTEVQVDDDMSTITHKFEFDKATKIT